MKKIVISVAIVVFFISTLLLAANQINVIGWYMVKPAPAYPTDGWSTSTPEAEGIDSDGLLKGYQYILDNKINAHSLLIVRNGRIADETYFYPYQKDDICQRGWP